MVSIVAALQMNSGDSVVGNLTRASELIASAADQGARLVVLPETFAFMGKRDEDMLAHQEADGDGEIQNFLASQAAKHSLTLVGGTVPLRSNAPGKLAPACLIYGSNGDRIGRYDKIHLFDVELPETGERYAESDLWQAGSEPLVVETDIGRLGLVICYDLRFPELFRRLVEMGADIIALPAAFTRETGIAHWDCLLKARAVENQLVVVASAQCGVQASGRETFGHSQVIGPWGELLSLQAEGEGVALASVDFDQQRELRVRFPVGIHRRL